MNDELKKLYEELLIASEGLLESLPAHWHGEHEENVRDVCQDIRKLMRSPS